jgi:hypothetical protein
MRSMSASSDILSAASLRWHYPDQVWRVEAESPPLSRPRQLPWTSSA